MKVFSLYLYYYYWIKKEQKTKVSAGRENLSFDGTLHSIVRKKDCGGNEWKKHNKSREKERIRTPLGKYQVTSGITFSNQRSVVGQKMVVLFNIIIVSFKEVERDVYLSVDCEVFKKMELVDLVIKDIEVEVCTMLTIFE